MIRKLLLSSVLSTVIFATQATAQSVPVVGKLPKPHLGIKLGANFDQLTGSNTWAQSYKPGIVFGAFGGLTKGHWGLQAEVLINTAQYDLKDSVSNGSFKALYLNIPVLIEYKVIPRVWVQVGPQFGTLLSMTASNSAISNPKSYFNSSAVSGVLGLQVILPVHLVAGARYILGFTDVRSSSVASSGSEAWKNRTIQAYLGFRFI